MKRLILSAIILVSMGYIFAQEEQPLVVNTFRCQQLSPDGKWMMGRSNTWVNPEDGGVSFESSLCNTSTGEIFGTDDIFGITPYSRPIANNGIAVLTTWNEVTDWFDCPYLVMPGQEPVVMDSFYKTGPYAGTHCYAMAITPDASAFLGYYEVDYRIQYPFVCTLNASHMPETVTYLPLPETDLFGNPPYYVQMTAISDDAKTVAGMVTDATGNFNYPIYYKQASDGSWSYTQPTAGLLDMDNLSNFPDFNTPQIALSPDGTKLACTRQTPSSVGDFADYTIWVFDLENNTYKVVESENHDLIATQIFNDGTILGVYFGTITITYIFTPGASDFIDFNQYVSSLNEQWGEWMDEKLMRLVYDYNEAGELEEKYLPDTGQIFMSEDKSTFASGFQLLTYDEWYNQELWSYVFVNDTAIGSSPSVAKSDTYQVFNLQGVKVMETKDLNLLRNLPKGLYIINDKKVIL